MCYADKLIVMPEHATLAPPICRLAGEVLSIGRRVTQKGVKEPRGVRFFLKILILRKTISERKKYGCVSRQSRERNKMLDRYKS